MIVELHFYGFPGRSVVLVTQRNASSHARCYDETLAALAAQRAAAQYLADLVWCHRAGKALAAVAAEMLSRLAQQGAPERLGTVSRALTTAADLEARALRVGALLEQLEPDDVGGEYASASGSAA